MKKTVEKRLIEGLKGKHENHNNQQLHKLQHTKTEKIEKSKNEN